MNVRMWRAAATRANVELLLRRGVELVGPETGELAEGESGEGRMAEPQAIAAAVRRRLEAAGSLRGLRVCVSAGGTREPLDAVRYLGNRSSGRMGVAVADEAARRGADVTLVLAAASARPAAPMRLVRAESAAELEQAVAAEAGDADVVVMAAAVADYRPSTFVAGKRPKDRDVWQLALEPTSDILAGLGRQRRPGQTLVGFAAEHGADGVERAAAKRLRKNADMIVVNDVSRSDIGFDSDDNELTIVTAAGRQVVGKRSKRECAAAVWDAIAALRAGAGEPGEGNRHARVTVGQGRERR
jgi:phosphopantothenoylcysteine decarboxylase/phosphopantothenate--cysteine ligase